MLGEAKKEKMTQSTKQGGGKRFKNEQRRKIQKRKTNLKELKKKKVHTHPISSLGNSSLAT